MRSRSGLHRLAKWLCILACAGVTIVATVVVVFALQARARLPELHAWHRGGGEQDFRIRASGAPGSFEEYRALEERLFADVRRRVMDNPAAADSWKLSRYNPNSVVAHLALDTMYNRSFERAPSGEPRGSVLLVHGLTDSPYSMRSLAETFAAQGFYVVALRLPGHGTTPSGLLDVSWEDWYGAVVLAAKYAASRGGAGKPFVAAGHSTGAALVTLYSLRALQDSSLPRPQQLYLVSAAIGVSPFAVLTNILSALSFIPGLEKSNWLDVLPEYDPYKYNSFPVNAAKQIYKLTRVLQDSLGQLSADQLQAFPRVHAYQSVVDSTVTAAEVARGLLARLPAQGNELVAFDVNRHERLEGLIAEGPLADLERIRAAVDLPYRLTLVANRARDTPAIAAYTREARASAVATRELPYEWPPGVFSVGHVSLPFPVDDPVYGLMPPAGTPFNLGAISPRGESGALVVGLGTFARLRSNPFFEVIRASVVESLATDSDHAAVPIEAPAR
jgi:alpha-beta hydrolase superfamily lysophospholipase